MNDNDYRKLDSRSIPHVQPAEVTALLNAHSAGDSDALPALLPLVYDDLKRIARNHIRTERASHTLDTTALVHESYLNLVDHAPTSLRSRAHFFAIASRVMRHILVDYARARSAQKRGGDHVRVSLTPELGAKSNRLLDLMALHQALERLAERHERAARVVECKVFGGMTTRETSEAVGVAIRTVEKDWALGKAFLHRELQP